MINIHHLCYHIDLEALIGTYITVAHSLDTVVAVYNPANYSEYLHDLGLDFDENEINFDKVLITHVVDVEDGLKIIQACDPTVGPICSLWSLGKRVTDNIEENLASVT